MIKSINSDARPVYIIIINFMVQPFKSMFGNRGNSTV